MVYDSLLIDVAAGRARPGLQPGLAVGYVGGTVLLVVNLVTVSAHDAIGLSTEGPFA